MRLSMSNNPPAFGNRGAISSGVLPHFQHCTLQNHEREEVFGRDTLPSPEIEKDARVAQDEPIGGGEPHSAERVKRRRPGASVAASGHGTDGLENRASQS